MLPRLQTAAKAGSAVLRGRAPGQLIIQLTDACNARCPQCGMNVTQSFERSKLEPDFLRAVIDTAADQGVMSLSITGGEPLLHTDEVLGLLGYAKQHGICYTRTGTNGSLFRKDQEAGPDGPVGRLARGLREAGAYSFWISMDSADESAHEELRGLPGVVDAVRRALPVFHASGVYPCVNLGINRNMGTEPIEPMTDPHRFVAQTRTALRDFYRAAIGMGFTTANVCYPMGLAYEDPTATYRATSLDSSVQFTSAERVLLFRVLSEVTSEFRSQIRIFTPLVSLQSLGAQHSGSPDKSASCRGGIDFFYLSATDGSLYPCGFRGTEPLGDPTQPETWKKRGCGDCRLCDWECFRDPSQLIAPLLSLGRVPHRTVRWFAQDLDRTKLWWHDLRYYSACGYFCASNPVRPERLSRFTAA